MENERKPSETWEQSAHDKGRCDLKLRGNPISCYTYTNRNGLNGFVLEYEGDILDGDPPGNITIDEAKIAAENALFKLESDVIAFVNAVRMDK
jgi:hypothetical protein